MDVITELKKRVDALEIALVIITAPELTFKREMILHVLGISDARAKEILDKVEG